MSHPMSFVSGPMVILKAPWSTTVKVTLARVPGPDAISFSVKKPNVSESSPAVLSKGPGMNQVLQFGIG